MKNTFMLKVNLSCISKVRLHEINSAKWVEGECATPKIGEVIQLSAIALLALDLISAEAETTNSPNPVDGDVQALIEFCNTVIADIKCDAVAHTDEVVMNTLQVFETALAAFTAVPDHYKIDVYRGDRLIASCHPSEPDHSPPEEPYRFVETAYYTTPPAHLLRPVELPTAYDIVERGPAYHTFRDLELDEDGAWLRKDEVIEALRQQGYEVK